MKILDHFMMSGRLLGSDWATFFLLGLATLSMSQESSQWMVFMF